jgi:AraC family transcriptional regulator of adaptative response / DNA-3-methyladenine glycosylase II
VRQPRAVRPIGRVRPGPNPASGASPRASRLGAVHSSQATTDPPSDDDDEARYGVIRGRDARFDGRFVTAVTSTGIYCRPSCPARTPRRENVRFYALPAAAQAAGFRACRRCRPDAVPGSAAWDVRGDLVARAPAVAGGRRGRQRRCRSGRATARGERAAPASCSRLGGRRRPARHRARPPRAGGPPAARRQRTARRRRRLRCGLRKRAPVQRRRTRRVRMHADAAAGPVRRAHGRARPLGAPVAASPAAGGRGPAELPVRPRRPRGRGRRDRRAPARPVAPALDRHRRARRRRRRRGRPTAGAGAARHRRGSAPVPRPARPRRRPAGRLRGPRQRPLARPAGSSPPGTSRPRRRRRLRARGARRARSAGHRSPAHARSSAGSSHGRASGSRATRTRRLTHAFPTAAQVLEADLEGLGVPGARVVRVRALASGVVSGTSCSTRGADRIDTERALLALPGIGPWTRSYVAMRATRRPRRLPGLGPRPASGV